MKKMLKVVELAWIIVAVLSLIEIVNLWSSGANAFWFFIAAFFIAIFMFFFRRKQRLRMEAHDRQKSNGSETE